MYGVVMFWQDCSGTGVKIDSIKFRAVLLGAYGSFRVWSVKFDVASDVPYGPAPAGRLMVEADATLKARSDTARTYILRCVADGDGLVVVE